MVTADSFVKSYLMETVEIVARLDPDKIDALANHLALARRVFVIGLGGSAAHASHMANDLRKLCGKDAICPTDNVSLMTALANDYSFDEWLVEWFELQGLPSDDEVTLFLSVGGGKGPTSRSLVRAAQTCKRPAIGLRLVPVLAIVGRDGGELAQAADCALVIPNLFPEHVTPHVEGLTSVICHLLVTHPALAKNPPKWRT